MELQCVTSAWSFCSKLYQFPRKQNISLLPSTASKLFSLQTANTISNHTIAFLFSVYQNQNSLLLNYSLKQCRTCQGKTPFLSPHHCLHASVKNPLPHPGYKKDPLMYKSSQTRTVVQCRRREKMHSKLEARSKTWWSAIDVVAEGLFCDNPWKSLYGYKECLKCL